MTDDIGKCIRTIRVLTSALKLVRNDVGLTVTQRQLVESAILIANEAVESVEAADADF